MTTIKPQTESNQDDEQKEKPPKQPEIKPSEAPLPPTSDKDDG